MGGKGGKADTHTNAAVFQLRAQGKRAS